MFELSKDFSFDAAHTLNRELDTDSSRRIHGHSYQAEVVICGTPDPATGMIIDLGLLEQALYVVKDGLDHRFLDDVPHLGPPTMENLALWVWESLHPVLPCLSRVTIRRDSAGERCTFRGHPST